MKTIQFKSNASNFKKEYLDIKRNTVRSFDKSKEDMREDILIEFKNSDITMLNIEITNLENQMPKNRKR